jgi:hypothetical protein
MKEEKTQVQLYQEIQDMQQLGLISQEVQLQMKEYEGRSLEETEKEVLALFADQRVEEYAQYITFDDLSKLTFDKAKKVIQHISLAQRIDYLGKLDKKLLYLYESTKGYNGQGFGKSMPVKDFMHVMGCIKHLEIIQTWLYGID